MQESISPTIGKNTLKREREVKPTDRNIRTRSTDAPQIHTDNSFLKDEFTNIFLSDIIPDIDFAKMVVNPAKNIEKLVKATSNYLALYGKELSFTPCGKFGQDMSRLINAATRLLPENQMLNMDYITNEFVFIVYQSHPKHYWDTITYIPVSIAHTMRPTIRKLFIRFIAFLMQQNNLPTIKDTCNYDFIVEDIQNRMSDNTGDFEEVEEEYIDMMRSYQNKTGKAYKLLQQIEQSSHSHTQQGQLLADLQKAKHLSAKETEQVACMIRGVELMSRDLLEEYTYDDSYDDYTNDSELDNEWIMWKDMICVSWGVGKSDPLVQYHYQMQNEQCLNSDIAEPASFIILSEEQSQKLPSCDFPFQWLKYICDDYFNYLVQDKDE